MLESRNYIIDEECTLSNSSETLVASSAGSVDGDTKTYDTGGGYTRGEFIVDVSAITKGGSAASCQTIEVCLEGSSTSTFTTFARLASFKFGNWSANFDHTRLGGDSIIATPAVGRYAKPFHNKYGDTILRWLRCYTVFGGTVSNNSIKFSSYISKR